ncbi:MAG: hypothetical protein ABSC48_07985 [Terracidiphilus sp.]|jgi:hypothetical protein
MPKENGSGSPPGNPKDETLGQSPRTNLPEQCVVSNDGEADPDYEEEGSEKPTGRIHWINHATFYLSIILAVLTAGTLRVYYLQLQQMARQTASAESSSYAACVSAQIARQTLLEVQSGEADSHNAASGTLVQATAETRGNSPLLTFGALWTSPTQQSQSQSNGMPQNWDNVKFGLTISNVGKTAAQRVRVKYASQILAQGDDPAFQGENIPFDYINEGVLAPSFFQGPTVAALRLLDKKGKPIGDLPRAQSEELQSGKQYIAIFGRADYRDTFGMDHWQTFCVGVDAFQPDMAALPKMRHSVCGNHNEIDKNLIYSIPNQTTGTAASTPIAEIKCIAPNEH